MSLNHNKWSLCHLNPDSKNGDRPGVTKDSRQRRPVKAVVAKKSFFSDNFTQEKQLISDGEQLYREIKGEGSVLPVFFTTNFLVQTILTPYVQSLLLLRCYSALLSFYIGKYFSVKSCI